MRAIMASANFQGLASRSTRRHFQYWSSTSSRITSVDDHFNSSNDDCNNIKNHNKKSMSSSAAATRRKLPAVAVCRIRSAISAFRQRRPTQGRLGHRVVGTLFGCRRGHVRFVLQREHNTSPVFFVELSTPITGLVKEMASGLVRIALECDKQEDYPNSAAAGGGGGVRRLLEEPVWRAYCNGKHCGFATKREAGPKELKILKTVEPISMGAGVLPGFDGGGSGPEGELMYMRAKFERVVGSRDSEAFYMMNPDSNGAPELSIYLLRV
ncbi:hypothetical protein Nepgr_002900 [Nepenthes gracilis]|uniref:Protein MIZU-KUSSEI 1 n=1 Tax=Nepenthes gracilis TaxID=150966 RepID=A0AAD3P735_NEPGR|nr:hypothetical protein Nepgr_002900 [Nepenthes gracilis]